MLVSELIEKLKEFDPSLEARFEYVTTIHGEVEADIADPVDTIKIRTVLDWCGYLHEGKHIEWNEQRITGGDKPIQVVVIGGGYL